LLLRILLIIGINLLTGCSSLATNTANYSVLEESDLPEELKETSGLYCPKVGSAYSVNDSGNEPIIYQVDSAGRIIDKKVITAENVDWEALTGDQQYFYIGDVGNNSGNRKYVQVHAVPKQDNNNDEPNVQTSKVLYINNSVKKNVYLNHDFDAETLINLDDNLFLFSKSWNTGILFIYQLNKTSLEQEVDHVGVIEGLPGIITGGDFDSKNNRFILSGYDINRLGSLSPFIAIVNKDLTLHKLFELSGYGQVEGICVTPNNEVWFTQESSFFSKQKLVKLNLTE
jgi:hypothetical protein